jgi:hypothetical protein
VLVVADFGADLTEVRTLAALGARVDVAGLGGEAELQALAGLVVDTAGVTEAREPVLEAALDRLAIADAVLFGAGDWAAEREEMFDAERELAIADGRPLLPFVARGDEAYAFLTSAGEAAAFALARAAGAGVEMAQKFAQRARDRKQERGHQNENRKPAGGGSGRRTRPRRGETR